MSSNGMANGYGVDGTTVNAGSKSNPWAINDLADLTFLKDNSSYWGTSVYYQQTADITLTATLKFSSLVGIYYGNGYNIDGSNSYGIVFDMCTNFTLSNVCILNNNCDLLAYNNTASSCVFKNIIIDGCTYANSSSRTHSPIVVSECLMSNIIVKNTTCTWQSTGSVAAYGGIIYGYWADWTVSASVYNSVVLSSTVNGGVGNKYVIAGSWATRSNNYAYNTSPSAGSSASDVNGQSITSTEYNSQSWWEDTALYNFDSEYGAWIWNSTTNLPELSHNVEAYDVLIYTYADLSTFAARINSGETSLNAILMDDIDCTDQTWVSIGTSTYPYAGTFNGNGHVINGISSKFISYASGIDVKNLKMVCSDNFTVSESESHGGILVGQYLNSSYNYITNTAIENINVTVSSSTESASYAPFGNLFTNTSSLYLSNSYASGTKLYMNISGAYHWAYCGGLVVMRSGYAHRIEIDNCYSNISTIATNSDSGYISISDGIMSFEYYSSTVTQYGHISNCVALGNTYTARSYKQRIATSSKVTMTNNYGLYPNSASITSSDATSINGKDVTVSEYTTQSWWEDTVGFDFDDVWYWDSSANLPKLRVFNSGASFYLKTNGSWVEGIPYIKVNSTWIQGDAVYVKVNGVWQLQQ